MILQNSAVQRGQWLSFLCCYVICEMEKTICPLDLPSGDSKEGPGEAIAPPDFCLAPCLATPVFFLIYRSNSFGWHRSYTYTVDNFVGPPYFSLAPK